MSDEVFVIVLIIFAILLIFQVYLFNSRGVKMLIPFILLTIFNLVGLLVPSELAEDSFAYAALTLFLFIWFDMIIISVYKKMTYRRHFIRTLKLAHIAPSDKNVMKFAKMIIKRRIKFEWFFKSSSKYVPTVNELYHKVMRSNIVGPDVQDILDSSLKQYGFDHILDK